MSSGPRVALVHDWLASYGGAEQVLLELHAMYPEAPIYTTVHEPSRLPAAFAGLDVRTSFLQGLPLARRRYQAYLPLMPLAFESFDLRGYDLVISDSHACAKGVLVSQDAVHLCYCHTPIRYAWSHQEEYLGRAPLPWLTSALARPVLAGLRRWDFVAAQGVDRFVCNSDFVQARIAKYYRRESTVVHPPVDLARFADSDVDAPNPNAPFLVVGRLVGYKRLEVAVEACSRLGLPLQVIGRGPERARLERLAGPSVHFLGPVSDSELEAAYRSCRALIFPSEEDFGIVPLEAMACGRPVLALGLGGALETVVPGVTGEHYPDGGVEPLLAALQAFDPGRYSAQACRARAREFSPERFRAAMAAQVELALAER